MTPEEVGNLDFPFVAELLDYWLEYPPEHILLRSLAGYEGKKKRDRSNWRKARADELGDHEYREPAPPAAATVPSASSLKQMLRTGDAKHVDCAPPHIQQAIERAKKNKHMDVPGAKP